ncbi:MAG: tripartite tricarboxylate transporter TctB family protein [Christensenellaceae bacterium]
MSAFFGLLGIFGFFVSLVIFLIQIFRKKSKRIPLLFMAVFFVSFVVGMSIPSEKVGSDDATDNPLPTSEVQSGVVTTPTDEALLQKQSEERHKLEMERKAREDKEMREKAASLFHEIRSAYKNNELSADDEYKGKSYTIIGEFDGVSEDGLFNEFLNEIMVTVKIIDDNTTCYAFCGFDADIWREKLSSLNKGDEMVIAGTCYSWGSWSDCELK